MVIRTTEKNKVEMKGWGPWRERGLQFLKDGKRRLPEKMMSE